MKGTHPNIDVIARIDTADMIASADVFHSDVVWHFFNPDAPELAGSYKGMAGIADFFQKVRSYGEGNFVIQPHAVQAVGDELVVVHSRNQLGKGEKVMEFDVVVVWRILDGKVSEVWDIPAKQTA
ncbi:nuclear transport factor 2 family protein [Roseobacter litoralis]|uniref:SnoaL-like domain-containing protein n=1 Tax=Roseobacter litoralis (strain ATCC 49566 / DSM 6996 / JCM 21268 / NBRC 15278 / OCh 149) TaxID=391595 RepID=F7ZHQ3_ROSLO|nr:nuclear transport factor 2 family protein [Roseobacter litoralis]AEI93663.1 hypothetical protein RLO149_c016710 [Roseobacter litoralis Och 149]